MEKEPSNSQSNQEHLAADEDLYERDAAGGHSEVYKSEFRSDEERLFRTDRWAVIGLAIMITVSGAIFVFVRWLNGH
jgi:hypothetical protein